MAEDFGSIARDTERMSLSDLGLGRWSRVFTSGASDCCFYRAVAGGGDIDPCDIVIAMKNYVDQRLEGGIDDEDGIESFDASDASNRYEDILKHLGGANSSNPIRDENRGGQDIDMWAACGALPQLHTLLILYRDVHGSFTVSAARPTDHPIVLNQKSFLHLFSHRSFLTGVRSLAAQRLEARCGWSSEANASCR